MSATAETIPSSPGWLRSFSFDVNFIAGIAVLALLTGAIAIARPDLFYFILLLDLTLLGYTHVISTYTRLCFDRERFRENRFLVLWLPPMVLGAVILVGFGVGLWVLASVYLYWQWFHYARQSWGISQVYRRKSNGRVKDPLQINHVVFYLLPFWGILYRSYQDPGQFLGLELRVIPVPSIAVEIAGLAALLALGWWLSSRAVLWMRGQLPVAHTLFMLSHFGIFYVAYIGIENINYGWLVINVWHNAQYIVFVWLFNNSLFKGQADSNSRFLSYISQNGKGLMYFAVCCSLAVVFYQTMEWTLGALLPLIVIYQTINFHHYIVDSVIWKIRRKPIKKVLGIAS